ALPFVLSARSPQALRDYAARLHTHLTDHPDLDLAAVATTLTHRTPHPHRAVAIATHHHELLTALHALTTDQPHPHLIQNHATTPGKTVFVLPGQGSQWPGMALTLQQQNPVFAHHLHHTATTLQKHLPYNLQHTLQHTRDNPETLQHIDTLQPLLFLLNTALALTWHTYGLTPDAYIGHSQGEIAAAHLAGALTLDQAAQIITHRSHLFATHLTGHGAIATLELPLDQTQTLLTHHPHLSIAGTNSPTATNIAGPTPQLHQLVTHLKNHNTRAHIIPATVPSHSPAVDPLHPHILNHLNHLTPTPTHTPLHSTLTTQPINGTHLTAQYWYDNARQPVNFHHTINNLLTTGHTTYLEPSPHPVLTPHIEQTAHHHNTPIHTITTLRRDHDTHHQLLTNLAHAWTTGHPITFQPTLPPTTPTHLPTYPFQHHPYWISTARHAEPPAPANAADGAFWQAVEAGDAVGLAHLVDASDDVPLREVLPTLAAWRERSDGRSRIDSWRYRTEWQPVGAAPGAGAATGTWLAVVPAAGEGVEATAVLEALVHAGVQVVRVPADPDRQVLAERLRT
ncbi:acyltransferase domain-containing protein, partial [Streptomyces sp. SID4948]|uniref:acyltransferase domain-containing protein n=1 Tax=Streptomyces sp. SID4948 TaxID=2690287 RepID=UPI0013694A80